jgi:hypothetical protein
MNGKCHLTERTVEIKCDMLGKDYNNECAENCCHKGNLLK